MYQWTRSKAVCIHCANFAVNASSGMMNYTPTCEKGMKNVSYANVKVFSINSKFIIPTARFEYAFNAF